MAIITLPGNLEFMEWAQQIQQDLPNQIIPNPISEETWHDWAGQLLVNNIFVNAPIPNKQIFPDSKDWKKWAAYFVNNVYTTN